jgi:CheY-like chemotaxis protein
MGTVLVVDDEKGVRSLIRKVLERSGHRVVEAGDGNEALTLFRQGGVDYVITDIIMPDKDGIETIATMRRESPTVKILAVSGGGRAHATDLLALAPRAGADAVLSKPFRAADLARAVARLAGVPTMAVANEEVENGG